MIRKPFMAGLGLLSLAADYLCKSRSQEQLVRDELRSILSTELGPYMDDRIRDMEWRYKQARDLYNEMGAQDRDDLQLLRSSDRLVTAEDINDQRFRLTGYTLNNGTNGSPAGTAAAGQISWTGLHIVYSGIDYTVLDAATTAGAAGTPVYVYFVLSAATGVAGTTGNVTLNQSTTKPTIGKDDILVFINNNGTAVVSASDGNGSLPGTVANNAIDNAALQVGAASGNKVGALLSTSLGSGIINAVTMFQSGIVDNSALNNAAVTGTKVVNGTLGTTKLNIASHILF